MNEEGRMNEKEKPESVEKTYDMRKRTKEFALQVINLTLALPKHPQVQVLGRQLLRSGTSVGANYREGYRARSPQEFISKLGICLQELEETIYWIELLEEGRLVRSEKLTGVKKEADELTAIFVSSIKTMKLKENK